MSDILTLIKALTVQERLDAKDNAREVIVRMHGRKPQRDDFANHTVSEYPAYVQRTMLVLVIVALVAAFFPSAMRLYHIGRGTFGHTIHDRLSMTVAGVSLVILAETCQIVFSLALAVLHKSKASRYLLYASIALSTSIALVGNGQLALGSHWYAVWHDPFGFLEAYAPPVIVLSAAYILKEQWLTDIRARHNNELAYQNALTAWQRNAGDPEQSEYWLQTYTSALRDMLLRVNSNGRGKARNERVELMATFTDNEWIMLVKRELNADNWFPSDDNSPLDITPSHNGNGHHHEPNPMELEVEYIQPA